MPVLAPRRESAPVLWDCFCQEWLRLSPTATHQWWQALQAAHWSRAVELRSMIQCQQALAHDWRQVVRLYEYTMAPCALVLVIEDLVQEGRVPRWQARRLEEAILAQTDRDGGWKGAA
jgi:hypothetical protein